MVTFLRICLTAKSSWYCTTKKVFGSVFQKHPEKQNHFQQSLPMPQQLWIYEIMKSAGRWAQRCTFQCGEAQGCTSKNYGRRWQKHNGEQCLRKKKKSVEGERQSNMGPELTLGPRGLVQIHKVHELLVQKWCHLCICCFCECHTEVSRSWIHTSEKKDEKMKRAQRRATD